MLSCDTITKGVGGPIKLSVCYICIPFPCTPLACLLFFLHTCKYLVIFRFSLSIFVRAKNEVNGPALTWAYNLFVVWVLDFLPWVVPNTKTQ